ncbi:MAG: hypothetical protein FJW35_02005 [Acidobacteria bacterium]|nr:hypothetical protein [Acidobacteriota bacterium]
MKRSVGGFVVAVAVIGLIAGMVSIASRAQTYEPVTVILHESLFDHAGTLKAKNTYIMAVRSDGSVVDEHIRDRAGVLHRNRTIHDRAAGKKTALDEVTQSKTTYHRLRLKSFEETYLSHGPSVTDEGEMILGERVVRVTQQDKQSLLNMWLAPDLNYCQLGVELVLYGEDGSIRARTVREAVRILRGEPNPLLFEIPEDYVERSPSEVYAEMERIGLQQCPACGDQADRDARLDSIYQRYRVP